MCLTTTTMRKSLLGNLTHSSRASSSSSSSPDDDAQQASSVWQRWMRFLQIGWDALLVPLALCFSSVLTTRPRAGAALALYAALCGVVVVQHIQQQEFSSSSLSVWYYYRCASWCLCGLLGLSTVLLLVVAAYTTAIVTQHAKPANPAALEAREQGLAQGRVIRGHGYDVYLPATSSSSSNSSYAAGMVFLPGALVSHDAYASVLSPLAAQGVVVVLVKLDPLRMPVPFYPGTTAGGMVRLISQVQSRHGISVSQWALAGHSAGGSTVAGMMQDAQLLQKNVHRVVLWGVNTTQDLERTTSSKVQALCITASQDGFKGKSMGRGSPDFATAWKDLPRLQHVEIQGGNHGGFADYPPQSFPRPDGVREITLAQQHEQIVQATAKFLLSKHE
mmetsp:Transcript_7858/g.14967  ORF Transcript_7858/g.14967 Transcript_7858/m.14967 type:complete len:390 (-) Transcript_7858:311-1480(-)